MRRGETRRLRLERCGSCGWLAERCSEVFVRNHSFQNFKRHAFSASMWRCGGRQSQLLHSRNLKLPLWARQSRGIRPFLVISPPLTSVEIRLRVGNVLLEPQLQSPGIGQSTRCIQRLCHRPQLRCRILHLRDTHGGLARIRLDQVVGIKEGPSMSDKNPDAHLARNLRHLVIPLPRIRVRVLFEHQVRDPPRAEQLWQNRLRGFAHNEQFGFRVQSRDGCREVGLAVEEELPPVGPHARAVDVVGVPGPDRVEGARFEGQSRL